jgi:medium-chain acyl-[acyl-carrier-protein] hydrolase
MRLFCFPYAGGGASFFRNWSNHLPPSIQVCPLQLPAREKRFFEAAYRRVPDLVRDLESIFPEFSDLPFAFFGHSYGTLVAYELTRRLRQKGQKLPTHLFMSANRGPQCPPKKQIHNLPEKEFLAELKNYGGMPEELLQNPELLELVAPALRADFEALETYIYEPSEPLAVPIVVFGGTEDPKVDQADLETWREQTQAGFQLHLYQGNHFYLVPNLFAVLNKIARELGHQTQLA